MIKLKRLQITNSRLWKRCLGGRLYVGGIILRLVDDWDAETNPSIYVEASLQWRQIESDDYDDWSDARQLSDEIVAEIIELR